MREPDSALMECKTALEVHKKSIMPPIKQVYARFFCLRLDDQPVELRDFPGNDSERVQLIRGALLSYDKYYSPA